MCNSYIEQAKSIQLIAELLITRYQEYILNPESK